MLNDYAQFIEKVKKKTNIDLSLYKEQQMKRRIVSLSNKYGYSNLQSFFRAMDQDRKLLDSFLSHMTINVTEFYRNRSQWDILGKEVFPSLMNKKGLKVWSAACSTGEEPYTLGILLSELPNGVNFSILATDLDKMVLNQAKVGLYSEKTLKGLTLEEKEKYFTKSGQHFQAAQTLKERLTFKQHDLLTDRFASNFDLIVCRNVMIYFTEEAKDKVFQQFSDSLNQNGVLFLGSTERLVGPEKYGLEAIGSFFFKKTAKKRSVIF